MEKIWKYLTSGDDPKSTTWILILTTLADSYWNFMKNDYKLHMVLSPSHLDPLGYLQYGKTIQNIPKIFL